MLVIKWNWSRSMRRLYTSVSKVVWRLVQVPVKFDLFVL